MFKNKAILVFGPRQTGKTTLVKQIIGDRSERTLFLNGDEPDVRALLQNATSTQLRNLIGGNRILVIDEAQRIPEIGLTLKLITDQIPEVQLIATGSSSFELANKANEPLTGRKYEFRLYPFSCEELTTANGPLEERRMLEQRLVFGSYPEIAVRSTEAGELLKLLTHSYLYKDLFMLEQVKKPVLLEKIVAALAYQIGSEVSRNEIAQLVQADHGTVERYISLLEQAFVVFRLPAYGGNKRNEIRKSQKIYFYDNGIRNAVIGNFSPVPLRNDVGPLWENYLMSERIKLLQNKGVDARRYFWRTTQQQEVDYIEEREGKLYAFEFKWNAHKKTKFSKTFTRNYTAESTRVIGPEQRDEFLLTV